MPRWTLDDLRAYEARNAARTRGVDSAAQNTAPQTPNQYCEASRKMWESESFREHMSQYAQQKSDRCSKMQSEHAADNSFSRCKLGFRADLGIYVRSSWEANYARFLNFKIKNEKRIASWTYEPKTFWFEQIKRGVRSYKPDFEVVLSDGSVEYHEVKGWMYPRAKTALNRMRIYHPSVKVVLIDQHRYRAIETQMRSIIPEWEQMDTHGKRPK